MILNRKTLVSAIKILLSLGVALFLFWYLYKDGFADTLNRLKQVDYRWVFASLVIGLTSHLARAYRWKLLLEPTKNYPSLLKCFMALMVGYLVNLAIPRLGELSRCLVLKRTAAIPVTSSLGTVVSERVLDVLSLLFITGITLLIEFDKLNRFFSSLFLEKFNSVAANAGLLVVLGLVVTLSLGILWITFKKRVMQSAWWAKVKSLLHQTWLGFISITRLQKPLQFWISTIVIWVLYYLTSYVVFFAMEPTSELGWKADMALLVMGGLAMSAPVQGGIGAFHLLVAGLLVYYGVTREDGLSFAFLLHSTQMVLMISVGTICAIGVLLLSKKPAGT